jgi:hypothetical protein
MELIAKKELVETPAAHIEASRTEQRYGGIVHMVRNRPRK